MKNLLFSGTANRPLAEIISKNLKIPLSQAEVIRFADSETRVRLEEDVEGADVFIVQTLSNPVDQNLVELALFLDSAKSHDARKVTAVIPYFGYARQDKEHRAGEAVSARVVAKMIQTAGAERIITVDLHSDMVTGFFNIHVKHVFGLGIFNDVVRKMKGDLVIVAPDAGGAKRAQRFADELNLPLAIIEKKRSLDKLHTVDSVRIIGDVKGHDAIIVDDVIVAGSTTAKASYALKESGARKVYAFATHADFVGDTVRLTAYGYRTPFRLLQHRPLTNCISFPPLI